MSPRKLALYSGDEAGFLGWTQKLWKHYDDEKAKVILEHLGGAESLLDVGCGPGQLLKRLADKVSKLVGVDESEEMLEEAARNCPSAELIHTKAEDLEFREEFDMVVTSQMLHEVKLFGTAEQMDGVLRAIWNALKPGGYFLLDHLDPGEGRVTVKLRQDDALLQEFVHKFRYRRVQLRELGQNLYEMERRDLQDFVTKTWALRSLMEEMEMNETHAAFDEEEAREIVCGAGFSPERFITLTNMGRDLEDHGIELQGKPPWDRKFLLISSKSS
jgi:ubiquinone/menaquinone biosynthesis C-methylase UbiE